MAYVNPEILAALENCEVLNDLDDFQRKCLAAVGELKSFNPEETVFEKHEDGDVFFIVVEGYLQLKLIRNQPLTYGPGDLFGEVAFFSEEVRLGTVAAKTPAKLAIFSRSKIFSPEQLNAQVAMQVTRLLTNNIISYLTIQLYGQEAIPSDRLILQGEGEMIEFKARYTRHVRIEAIYAIAAFMNRKGGTVFLGVDDSGEVLGFKNKEGKDIEGKALDEAIQAQTGLIRDHLGPNAADLVSIKPDKAFGKLIVRLDCEPAPFPVVFKHKELVEGREIVKEIFYIRSGPSNHKFEVPRELIDFIRRRFQEGGRIDTDLAFNR